MLLLSSLCTQNVQSNQLGQNDHVRRVARALTASAATIFLVAVSTARSACGVRFFSLSGRYTLCFVCALFKYFTMDFCVGFVKNHVSVGT